MNFPLYDNLSKDAPDKDLLVKQKTELVKSISNMDSNDKELVYTIIRVYQKNHTDDELDARMPFGGEKLDKGIKFNLDKFPNPLKQMLYKFITLHSKKIAEEQEISVHRDS